MVKPELAGWWQGVVAKPQGWGSGLFNQAASREG